MSTRTPRTKSGPKSFVDQLTRPWDDQSDRFLLATIDWRHRGSSLFPRTPATSAASERRTSAAKTSHTSALLTTLATVHLSDTSRTAASGTVADRPPPGREISSTRDRGVISRPYCAARRAPYRLHDLSIAKAPSRPEYVGGTRHPRQNMNTSAHSRPQICAYGASSFLTYLCVSKKRNWDPEEKGRIVL